jgi:TPR repeat protein
MQLISEKVTEELKASSSWNIQDSLNIPKNKLNAAFELAQEGAASGCIHCKGALARCYYYGNGVAENATLALELATESAAAGSPYGQFVLGRCFQEGQAGEKDNAQAVRLYRLAADQGLAIAQHYLGNMLFFGSGVEENEEEAELLWNKAIVQGYRVSFRMLAYMYEKRPPSNPAIKLWVAAVFEAAAEMGDAHAQLQLGRLYEEGLGVFVDTKKALKLYKSAKLQGLEEADAALVAALTCGDCSSKYVTLCSHVICVTSCADTTSLSACH